jgi:hypothetical protein
VKRPGDALLHPLTLAMLALWVLNDHVLKQAVGGFVTGKLSDIAGLAVFPLLPAAFFEWWRARRGRPHGSNATLLLWSALTGAVLVSIKLLLPAASCYRWGLACLQWPVRALLAGDAVALAPVSLTMDATDCATLPALGIALFVGWHRAALVAADGPRPNARATVARWRASLRHVPA